MFGMLLEPNPCGYCVVKKSRVVEIITCPDIPNELNKPDGTVVIVPP